MLQCLCRQDQEIHWEDFIPLLLQAWAKQDWCDEVDLSTSHDVDEEYPDRVNNPQDYKPLLDQSRQRQLVGNEHPTYGIAAST